ncbi:indolethylamine N-methyltransferase-like isoform X2 [Ambystoma mexicanum]|uniref:indolethylamine N-methyltransferase-like isoform X2 n=1 Tax=Ambystoma mexicanum TaxID=8296 RepID=UPI0037E80754
MCEQADGPITSESLCKGAIKGDTVIQFGGSYVNVALLPACELFKDIIIIDFLDSSLQTATKWLKEEAGAHDWGALEKCLGEMEGGRLNWSQLEETMRGKAKEIIKADLAETHPVAPKLSIQADCLYTALCLELLCAN